ncbi:MAG: DNA replication and repair protein RecF [Candidatus Tectomicrobia bacterium]|nr:DNA replication and repair protein RecF [Candidatus Tectomicrobia bacterium]
MGKRVQIQRGESGVWIPVFLSTYRPDAIFIEFISFSYVSHKFTGSNPSINIYRKLRKLIIVRSMYLEKLYTENFRNVQTREIRFSRGINLFFGNNGQGKTNLLEAVYFLGNLKSFRKARRNQLLMWDQDRFGLKGIATDEKTGEKASLETIYNQGRTQSRIDGEEVGRLEDYLSRMPVVAFHPESLSVLKGGPAFRRAFIDRGIFWEDRSHLPLLKGYNRVLAERRWILKNGRRSMLEVWNRRLADMAVDLALARASYCGRLNREMGGQSSFPGEAGPVELRYRPSVEVDAGGGKPLEDLKRRIRERVEAQIGGGEGQGASQAGPHRDEFRVFGAGRDLAEFGSQGQQREALLRLVLAQAALAGRGEAGAPLLVLDDVMSELDRGRAEWLHRALESVQSQVFISALEPIPLRGRSGAAWKFAVRRGEIEQTEAAA